MTDITYIKKMTSAASDLGAMLSRVWPPVKRVLTFSLADEMIAPKKSLSVSIEKGNISIAYGSRFLSKIRIRDMKNYSFQEGRYPQPEDLLSSLSLALNEFNASGSDITLSIPKAWAIIRTVEFPSTVKDNIPEVISYELDRLTPFTAEEAFFDFRLLEDRGDRISLVLLAAKADQIRPYLDILNENGLTANDITVNLSAMGTLCGYMMEKKSDILFVEIENHGYEGGIFEQGMPTSTFSGVFTGPDEKTKIEAVSRDIKSLLRAARDKGRTPHIVTLLKDNSPALRELLKSGLGAPAVALDETDIGLKLPPRKEIPWAAVGSIVQSLLWTNTRGFNLLSKGRHERRKTPLALTILLTVSIAITWFFYLSAPLRVEGNKLRQISGQIETKKEEAKKVEVLKKEAESVGAEIAVITNFKNDRTLTLNILKELTSTIPRTAWLSRVRITTTSVEIEGYAGAATELLPKLEASKYFRKVEFASSTIRDSRMNADRFNIKMEIENSKDIAGEKVKNEKK